MPVTFTNTNIDRIPAPWRATYQGIIRQAIDTMRPDDEHWTVTTHEPRDGTAVTLEFAREVEVAQSFQFAPEDDDADHAVFYRSVCDFLRRTWTRPGDYGVFQRADNLFDVFMITASRDREDRRSGLSDLNTAHDIARAGLEDGGGRQVWFCHHSNPDRLEPYR